MTNISIAPSFEQTQCTSEILPKKSCEASRVFHIITLIITALATLGGIISSVITGILPLLSICALAIPLLLISSFLLRRSCLQTKTPEKIDIKSLHKSLPLLFEINENTRHTKILEQYGEVVTDWNSLPRIFGETTPSLLNKTWKINHSKTVLFTTTGVIYSPRVHCCCNLLIVLEHNTSISDLDTLNISCEIPNIQRGSVFLCPGKTLTDLRIRRSWDYQIF